MTAEQAGELAERARDLHAIPAEAVLEIGERRIIELATPDRLVRDVRVWLCYFGFRHRHVELAVDEVSGDIVRVQRSR